MNTKFDNSGNAIVGLIAVVVIGALVAGTIVYKNKNNSSTGSTSSSNSTSSDSSNTTSSTSAASNTSYKNGTYSATGSYTSPGGNEEIDVAVTISNGVVTNSAVTPHAASGESSEYQSDFVAGYRQLVVGKKLTDIQLGKVSGSSLTSRGFNQALDEIRNKAQS